jgi:hypothetical protein
VAVHVERSKEMPGGECVRVALDPDGDSIVWVLATEISEYGAAALATALDAAQAVRRSYYGRLQHA